MSNTLYVILSLTAAIGFGIFVHLSADTVLHPFPAIYWLITTIGVFPYILGTDPHPLLPQPKWSMKNVFTSIMSSVVLGWWLWVFILIERFEARKRAVQIANGIQPKQRERRPWDDEIFGPRED